MPDLGFKFSLSAPNCSKTYTLLGGRYRAKISRLSLNLSPKPLIDGRYRAKISKLSNWTLNLSASFDDQEVKQEKLREEVRGLHKHIAARDETIAELRGRNRTLKDQASAVARQLASERKR